MTIVRFSKEEFELALPTNYHKAGLEQGEYTYTVPAGEYARVMVRSSVSQSGLARDTGEDSIRLWLEAADQKGIWVSLKNSEDLSTYTTRTLGWERRMGEKIGSLQLEGRRLVQPIPICQDCGVAKRLYFTRKPGKNMGRPFAKCPVHNGFEWMDEGAKKTLKKDTSFLDELFAPLDSGEAAQAATEPMTREPDAQQRLIIEAPIDRAIRVLAGPGSGKTFSAENRIKHLVEQYGAKPGQILYVTFTKTMADEGGKRIGQTLKGVLTPMEIMDHQKWFCTIHACCYRILKAEGDKRNVAKNWEVKKQLEPIIADLWQPDPEWPRPSAEEVFKAISNAKHYGQRAGHDEDFFVEFFGDYHGSRLSIARARYDAAMKRENLLAFGDMLFDVEQKLMRDDNFCERWQNQFRFVIVDEGQDTSAQSMRILTKLAEHAHFMVVGDADQLLMRFAGATPEANLYEGFTERYPQGRTFFMETNYRASNQLIVSHANAVIAHNYMSRSGPYDDQFLKNLKWRGNALEGVPVDFVEHEDAVEEANALVANIQEQLLNGRQPGDIFVGARTRAQLGYLEGPLTASGVPFINIKGGSFWLQSHVADMVAYLRIAHDDENKDAFKRIYNKASRHFRDHTKQYVNHRWLGGKFLLAAGERYTGTMQAVSQNSRWLKGAQDLVYLVNQIKAKLYGEGPAAGLRCVLEECYEQWLKTEEGNAETDEADGGKLNDIQTVVDLASRFTDVEAFFKYVDDAVEASRRVKDRDWDEFVVISTIHGLKGLERPVVYGVGISEGEVLISESEEPIWHKVTAPYGLLPHTFSLTEPPRLGVLNFGGQGKIEDERCIFFVLLTRAKDECHLSGIRVYRRAMMWPSRFVYEAGILQGERHV